jgi:hypothetical protein
MEQRGPRGAQLSPQTRRLVVILVLEYQRRAESFITGREPLRHVCRCTARLFSGDSAGHRTEEPNNRITEELPSYGARSAIAGKYKPRCARFHQSPVVRRVEKSVNE